MDRTRPRTPDPRLVDDLAGLGDVAGDAPSLRGTVEAVRDLLGMEVAYVTRIEDARQEIEAIVGQAGSFGLHVGSSLPVDETLCHRVLSGRLPHLIRDARADDRAATLDVVHRADLGGFASYPLTFSDGRTYGTLCAASHDAADLGYRDLQFLRVFARMAADLLEREQLQREAQVLRQTAHELELQSAASAALLAAVQARDAYTAEHSHAVVERAMAVAAELGLDDDQTLDVRNVALLHDIGKISIPDAILAKEGPLDDAEWEVMRGHPVSSEVMVRHVPGLEHLAPMVRAEHERWDGTGYPDGLAGEEIPLPSRITLVCDAYHAMTSDRPYRPALTPDQARERIADGLGTQFCPTAGRALLAALERR